MAPVRRPQSGRRKQRRSRTSELGCETVRVSTLVSIIDFLIDKESLAMRVSRRSFLVTAAAAAASAPAFLGATDESGSKAPILGQGEHQYEAIHDWGDLPRTIKYGNTHGVCEDSQGNIYVHHTVHATSDSLDTMVVFDPKGKFVRSWGKQFKGGAHGLTIRKAGSEEFLYLC